jgi:DNA polymerase III epsilon subunit-like protein
MDKQICFIYTETNGLHKTDESVSKKKLYCFARMVCLNYEIGYFKNNEFIQEKKVRFIVKPRCMTITDETTAFHGITQQVANDTGSDIEYILKSFKEDIKSVDVIVSHNIDFHLRTILAEAVKYNFLIDFKNYIIIDTLSFYHNYGYLKLKELAKKLKITDDLDNNLELIKNVFLKLYVKYQKTVKKA